MPDADPSNEEKRSFRGKTAISAPPSTLARPLQSIWQVQRADRFKRDRLMRSTPDNTAGKVISWLLVGLTLAPLLAARAEATDEAGAAERLAWLLAQHDVRELINVPPADEADCAPADAEDKQ
jgi:hypothetical protein